MQLVRLPKSKVKIGVPLIWNVRLEDKSLLLKRGQVLQDEHQLDLLLERGAFVDIEEIKIYGASMSDDVEQPKVLARPAMQASLFELWEKAIRRLEELLKGAHVELAVLEQIDVLARDIVALAARDADIAIYMMVRQDKAPHTTYGYSHAVYVAAVCVLLTRRLHWADAKTLTLVKAALTMNVSIMALQGRLAAQEEMVLDKQRAEIRKHPQQAVEWLTQYGASDEEWLTAVAQHHECADGSGYPLGLTELSPMAQVLRLADIFMAKISRRATREPLSPQEAARHMLREDNGGAMSMALIKEIGIYPPGDFVKLKSGEQAVVVRRSENTKTPMVACITDAAGKPSGNTPRRDTAEPEFAITGVIADRTLAQRVPPERLYGAEAMG